MNSTLMRAQRRAMDRSSYYVVTPDDVVPLAEYGEGSLSANLNCLIGQEVRGRRSEAVPDAMSQLLQMFGFEWEPLSEPGHMRLIDDAALMLYRAKVHAAATADRILSGLGIPSLRLDGVNLIDPSAPVVSDYLRLISQDTSLYGESPYRVSNGDGSYMLRQTSCFQKYSACLDWALPLDSLPLAVSEISDSFRREPEETLQLSFRLRRFHLPESHIHCRSIKDAIDLSLQLHPELLSTLDDLEADLVMLISATHDFASSHQRYLKQLASRSQSVALLKVSPPGVMCEDGVEVDVEYKLVDSLGCCRELSTFQIDQHITRTFGLRCDDGTTPTTIHAVFTGGVERYLFFTLDRIVRLQSAGVRCHLPLWLSPVAVRVIAASAADTEAAQSIAHLLSTSGIRTELDDESRTTESAIQRADDRLIPYLVQVTADSLDREIVKARDIRTGLFRDQRVRDFIAEITPECEPPGSGTFSMLSRKPRKLARASLEV